MKRVVISLALLAALATPAFAQGMGQGVASKQAREPSEKEKIEAQQRRQRLEETEKNYSATIKNQPDSKEKYDPWKGAR